MDIATKNVLKRLELQKNNNYNLIKFAKLNNDKRSINIGAFSNIGLIRQNNEDNFLVNCYYNRQSLDDIRYTYTSVVSKSDLSFFGVFDGMGGGEDGEIASLAAAEEISKELSSDFYNIAEIDKAVRKGFMSANSRIIDEHLKYCICGTTGTLLCIFQDKFKIYHMGDSRAYLLRNKDLFLLTKDQTLAEMKMTLGFYKKNDPLIEKEKHQLIEYIGCDWAKEGLKPEESKWEDLEDGDRVLLCSDGLYDMCSDLMISDILVNNNQVEIAVQKLIDTSIKNGGKDNVTCLLVEYNF